MNPVVEAVRKKYPGTYDDLTDDQLTIALGQKYGDAYSDIEAFTSDFQKLTQPSLSPSVPEPGDDPIGMAKTRPREVTQAFPVTPQEPPPQRPVQMPEPVPFEAVVRQEPAAPEAQIELPRFGSAGTISRGASEMISGVGEWALNKPEEFVGTLLSAPVRAAIEIRYAPEIVANFVKDVVAGAKGDKEAVGRALAIFAAVAGPKAVAIARREAGRAKAATEQATAEARAIDAEARAGMQPGPVEQPALLPRVAAELSTGTAPETVTFRNAPDRGERRKLLKSMAPEVPATPPEPQRNLTVLEEIRQRGADTKEKIRAIFPHLTREEAAALRDQVFPKTQPPPKPETQDATRIRENEGQVSPPRTEPEVRQTESRPDLEQPAPEQPSRPELPSRASDDVGKPPAEEVPLPDVETPAPKRQPTPKQERPWDIIDEIESNIGKIRGKKSAKPGEEGYYSDAYRESLRKSAVRKLYSNREGQSIDSVLDDLRRRGVVGKDFSVDDLHDALIKAADARQTFRKSGKQESNVLQQEEAVRVDFEKEAFTPDTPQKKGVNVDELLVGDEFELAGEKVRVKELEFDPDSAELSAVIVEDGRRFGVQRIGSNQTIYPDAGTLKQKPAPIDFAPEERTPAEINRELNALKAKEDLTAVEKERIRELEAELGQKDLLDVAPDKTPEQIEAEKKAAEQKEKIAELQNKRLRGEDALEQNLFDEDKGLFGAQPSSTTGAPLSPTPTPVPTKPPKSQRQIITDIAKGLKLPIRFGRLLHPRYGGYFQKIQNLIASKRANDIPVVTHEAGHKLDSEFKLSSEPVLRAELDILGDPKTSGSMSSWTPSKSQSYKMGEGVAEFVRYWMIDPAHARTVAPNVFRRFEEVLDANKDFGDVMRQAQEDIRLWRSAQPQARLRSHISVGDNPNATRYTLSQATRDLLDDLHILRLATDDANRFRTAKLDPSRDPYMQARLLRGAYGMADTFVQSGTVDFRSKSVKLGSSLEDALSGVAGRINDFRDWIVAKRALELEQQGRRTGFLTSDLTEVILKFQNDPAFQDAFQKVKDWQDALLQYAVDAGLVTKQGAAAMRRMNEDYVPFHRVFEVGAGEPPSVEGGGSGRGLNVGKPGSIRTLKGSQRDVVDPIETMVKNAYALITAAEKANIHRSIADMANMRNMGKWVERIGTPKDKIKVGLEKLREQLEDAGADLSAVPDDLMLEFFQNSKHAPFGENTIRIVRNGQPEFYRLNKDLYDTFHALDMEDAGALIRAWSSGAQLLRSGVVLEPSFAVANAIRDTISAAVLSKYNALPFEVTLRGVAAMVNNPKLVAEWAAAGGKNAIEAAYFDRAKMQTFLREKITKDLTPSERALVMVRSPLTALRWLTEKAEEATRIGEYQKAFDKLRKSGMPEGEARQLAAFEARDRQDFAKGGTKTKIIRRVSPFWNAALQANVKLAQTLKERPAQTILKGLAFVTIPKLLEQAVNWEDQDYWDRPQWERDLFFLIPFDKDANGRTKFIRIPTPFEIGLIFGTFPGRILQYARDRDDPATESYMSTLARNTIPVPFDPMTKTIIETALTGEQGWDIYRGREIIPDRLADLPADMQWTAQNSLTAKKLGALLGISPMKIDHVIRATTGGVGQQMTYNVTDPAIAAVTGEELTAKGKAPGGRFITSPAGTSSQAVETFYDFLGKINGEAQRVKMTGNGKDFALLSEDFSKAAKQMGEWRKLAREAPDEKERQLYQLQIADLAKDMNRLAREFGVK